MSRLGVVASFHNQLVAAGADPNGWGSEEGQRARFAALLRAAGYRGGSVLDYGCGTGALRRHLAEAGHPFTYLGVDMNADLLRVARRETGSGEFELIAPDSMDVPPADYVFASGVFQFADPIEPTYYQRLVANLFERCRLALSVNFLSALRAEPDRDAEELYITPAEAVNLATSLSGKWVLDHSYHPARGDVTLSVHR